MRCKFSPYVEKCPIAHSLYVWEDTTLDIDIMSCPLFKKIAVWIDVLEGLWESGSLMRKNVYPWPPVKTEERGAFPSRTWKEWWDQVEVREETNEYLSVLWTRQKWKAIEEPSLFCKEKRWKTKPKTKVFTWGKSVEDRTEILGCLQLYSLCQYFLVTCTISLVL